MPRYNRSFDLSIPDVDLIEEALRARGRELSRMRLALSADNPTHLDSIRVIEQDQRAGAARVRAHIALHQMLNQRQAECGGLAGSGLGKAHDIAAIQREGNRALLDGGRFCNAQCCQLLHQRAGQAHFLKQVQIISFRAWAAWPHTLANPIRGSDLVVAPHPMPGLVPVIGQTVRTHA